MSSFIEDEQVQDILFFVILLIFVFPILIFILYGSEAVEVFFSYNQ